MAFKEPLPDFRDPPAVETLLAVYFTPLENWKTPYFGLFWQDIKRDYPDVEVHPPLPSEQHIRVELNQQQAKIKVEGEVAVRWWYFHRSQKRLIQLQNGSFIQNWRKRDQNDPYLHYDELRPSFQHMWERFLKFLNAHNVSGPNIRECEVTYVNHIDRGRGWKSFADLGEVIPIWSGKTSGSFLPSADLVSMNVFYPIERNRGRLQVSVQPGIRQSDGQETLQVTLSARCKPQSSDIRHLFEAFALGREWVVRGFADVTTERMHTAWGAMARKPTRRRRK